MCGKLEVQVCDNFSLPVGMYAEYLIISSGGPVIFGINNSPFLGGHRAEDKGMSWFVTAFYKCAGDAEHHGNRCIVILKSVEIGIIVSR